jgi:dipeptidase D
MTDALKGLKPELVWKYFGEISRIPRCSRNEAAAAAYVLETAGELGLRGRQDDFGNVVVEKPAAPGRENIPAVVLQGHLDMVCEKNADKVHDFSKDPIELVRRDNILMANGTTLGADNGIAVAASLAVMADKQLEHGPLELLFTVDEETGLTGASNLQGNLLKGRTLLNLDSEEEGAIYVGCAGGKNTTGRWRLQLGPAPENSAGAQIRVAGLRGGHSGLEIDKGRANAVKILGRVLTRLLPLGARLADMQGGNKLNAIPREAEASFYLPEVRLEEARAIVSALNKSIRAEFSTLEPDLTIEVAESAQVPHQAIGEQQQARIIKTLLALPHGVTKMSAEVPGLVETSTNVAAVHVKDGTLTLGTSQRSSVASEIEEIVQTVRAVFELGGAEVEHSHGYPGWKPDLNSPILKHARETYRKLYGKDPEIKAVHAGLECGIIGERFPGMDMISFGPTLEGVHSPEEKIYIDSVETFWEYLTTMLRDWK